MPAQKGPIAPMRRQPSSRALRQVVNTRPVLRGIGKTRAVVTTDTHPVPAKRRGDVLRRWWHEIQRLGGQYSCYAIFLALPSDKEAIRYLHEFGKELDLISGEDCLVVAIGKTEIRRSGFDERIWKALVKEHISEGYSMTVARFFGIGSDEFPCLLVFEHIRSPRHVAVALRGMKAEEISERTRSVFSVIQKAVSQKRNPLVALQKRRNNERFIRAGKTIVSELHTLAEKTFEKAMEAWIRAVIKSSGA